MRIEQAASVDIRVDPPYQDRYVYLSEYLSAKSHEREMRDVVIYPVYYNG